MSPEEGAQFAAAIQAMATERGACVVEAVKCDCGQTSLAAHTWTEVVSCHHCGKKHPSRVPRLPLRGEITLDHVTAAIQTLKDVYSKGPLGKWPADAEWAALSEAHQLVCTKAVTAGAIAVLKQVESLSQGFATAGGTIGV